MSKRVATESLEDLVAGDSPAPKKVRLQEVQDESLTNGNGHNNDETTNGTPDILGAAEEMHEELKEVAIQLRRELEWFGRRIEQGNTPEELDR